MVPRNNAELIAMTVIFTLLRAAWFAALSVYAIGTEAAKNAAH